LASAAKHRALLGALFALGACGDGDSATDAGVRVDARVDAYAGPRATPSLVANGKKAGTNVATLSVPITVPAGLTSPRLYVSVHVGGSCGYTTTHQVQSVTLAGMALTRMGSRVGSKCQTTPTTRTEIWELLAPPEGAVMVNISIGGGTSTTLHSIAFVVDNVDDERPFVTAVNSGTSGMIAVPSAPGELVIAALGTGNTILDTPAPAIVQNVTTAYALDNSAVFTATSTTASTSISFAQANTDEWQFVALSLLGTPAP